MISLNQLSSGKRMPTRRSTQTLADQLQREMVHRRVTHEPASGHKLLRSVSQAIEKHPEIAIGAAAIVGLLVGITFRRR